VSLLSRWVREPAFINALQILGYAIAATAGLLAAMGGLPTIVTGQIGPTLAVIVGIILVIGGLTGAWSVITGMWWLERAALWITGVGYVTLLVPTLFFAFTRTTTTSTIWLIVALEVAAIIDNAKRYRRIDWAYLNPAR
jgi:hypothetical protein